MERRFVFDEPEVPINAPIAAEAELAELDPAPKAGEVRAVISPLIHGSYSDLINAKGRFPVDSSTDITRHPDGTVVDGQLRNCIALGGRVIEVEHNLPAGIRLGLSFPGFAATHSGGHAVVVGETRGAKPIDAEIGQLVPVTAATHYNVWHPNDLKDDILNQDAKGADVATKSPIITDLLENGGYDPATGKTQIYEEKHFKGETASLPTAHIQASIARLKKAYDAASNIDITDYSPRFELIPPAGKTLKQVFDNSTTKTFHVACRAEVAFQPAGN